MHFVFINGSKNLESVSLINWLAGIPIRLPRYKHTIIYLSVDHFTRTVLVAAVGSINILVGPVTRLTFPQTELASMEDTQEDSTKQRLRNNPRYPARTQIIGSRIADDPTGPSELQEPEPVVEKGATSNTEQREELRELLAATKQEITSMTHERDDPQNSRFLANENYKQSPDN